MRSGLGRWLLHGTSHELQNEPHGNGDACTGLEASRAKPSRPKVKGSWPARAGARGPPGTQAQGTLIRDDDASEKVDRHAGHLIF